MVSVDDLKKLAVDRIDSIKDELHEISSDIWKHPELKYEENHAHEILTAFLKKHELPVEEHFVTATGFRSIYSKKKSSPNIAVLCEYDALPEIGHACGHNLIAEVGIGAALGLKTALDAAMACGKDLGTLTVFGTPAEEGGGGKIDQIRTGAYDTIDAALMAHPWPCNVTHLSGFGARAMLNVRYHGKASHAAGFPWEGVNALDAAIMAYTAVSVMRQQLKPDWRIHGIIKNGGAKPNIIPEYTELEFYLRAPTVKELETVKKKTEPCFHSAAAATGCTVEVKWGEKPYDNLVCNNTLATLYEANARSLGHKFITDVPDDALTRMAKLAVASTDMGNVSHVVPGLHPLYKIGTGALNHTRPFTALAGSPDAQAPTLLQAKALAMTAIDIYCNPELVETMKTELQQDLEDEQKA